MFGISGEGIGGEITGGLKVIRVLLEILFVHSGYRNKILLGSAALVNLCIKAFLEKGIEFSYYWTCRIVDS